MTRTLVAYLITVVLLVVIDGAYLATIGAKMFKATLGDVLAPSVTIPPAVLFYLIFPAGLMTFVITPALNDGRWTTALVYGALFGFFAYACYDLTNFATIRNWTATITVADIAWGTVLSAVTSALAFAITRAIFGTA